MKRIAICGGIGSGKSAVTAILRENGAKVVVADEINASLLSDPDYIALIRNIFPEEVDNNGINKKELAKRIYQNESDRVKLMQLAHPKIFERMLSAYHDESIVFYEIPLMAYCKIDFDAIWFVRADLKDRIARIISRDGVDEVYAKRILLLQAEEGKLSESADVVIDNTGDLDALRKKVKSLYYSTISRYS